MALIRPTLPGDAHVPVQGVTGSGQRKRVTASTTATAVELPKLGNDYYAVYSIYTNGAADVFFATGPDTVTANEHDQATGFGGVVQSHSRMHDHRIERDHTHIILRASADTICEIVGRA